MFILNAKPRAVFGKHLSSVRATGLLPVVVYGAREETASCFVDTKEFVKIWQGAGESSLISFRIDGEEKDVLIHDVALDPTTDRPVHADLYAVEKNKMLRVHVPLLFVGTAPAVKSLGGILIKVLHEVEVEALPRNLPHTLTVDISTLATFEDHVRIHDIALPEEVKIVFPHGDEIIASVQAPKEEKEEEAVPVDLSKIEVEKKGKKEEEGAPAEGEAEKSKTDKGKVDKSKKE